MSYIRLLFQPIPRWLWLGQTLSATGSRLHSLALLWIAYQLTGSALAMGATGVLDSIVATVVGLAGSAYADRRDRLLMAALVDTARAVFVLALPCLIWTGHLHYIWLLVFSVVMGAFDALFDPAFEGALPGLMDRQTFYTLAGLLDTPSRLARIFGPGFAGMLLTVLPVSGFFVLDALSFAASAISILRVRQLSPESRSTSNRDGSAFTWHSGLKGLRFIAGHRPLLIVFSMDFVGNLGFPVFSLGGVMLMTHSLHAGLAGYGWFIGAYGIGSLFGNGLSGNWNVPIPRPIQATGGWLGIGLAFAGMGLVHSLAADLCLSAFAGAFGAMAHVSRAAYLASEVPSGMLSKVHGVRNINGVVSSAIGMAVCGVLLDRTGVLSAFMVIGLAVALVDGWMLWRLGRFTLQRKKTIVPTTSL